MINIVLVILLSVATVFCNISGEESSPTNLAWCGLNASLPMKSVSLYSNPSWMAEENNMSISASLMNYFNIDGLNQGQLSIVFPIKAFMVGTGLSYLTVDSIYNEGLVAIGSAYGFHRLKIGAVAKLGFRAYSVSDRIYTASVSSGLNFRLISGLSLSFAVSPLFETKASSDNSSFMFKTGLSYIWAQGTKTAIEAEYEKNFPVIIRFAQELELFNILFIRAGVRSEPLMLSLGFGVRIFGFAADIAGSEHSDLGTSRCAGVTFDK